MLPTINRPSARLAVLSLGLLGAICVIPPASAQLIDAGGQANLMQQHALMRNQSTGDGPDWIDREAVHGLVVLRRGGACDGVRRIREVGLQDGRILVARGDREQCPLRVARVPRSHAPPARVALKVTHG